MASLYHFLKRKIKRWILKTDLSNGQINIFLNVKEHTKCCICLRVFHSQTNIWYTSQEPVIVLQTLHMFAATMVTVTKALETGARKVTAS